MGNLSSQVKEAKAGELSSWLKLQTNIAMKVSFDAFVGVSADLNDYDKANPKVENRTHFIVSAFIVDEETDKGEWVHGMRFANASRAFTKAFAEANVDAGTVYLVTRKGAGTSTNYVFKKTTEKTDAEHLAAAEKMADTIRNSQYWNVGNSKQPAADAVADEFGIDASDVPFN